MRCVSVISLICVGDWSGTGNLEFNQLVFTIKCACISIYSSLLKYMTQKGHTIVNPGKFLPLFLFARVKHANSLKHKLYQYFYYTTLPPFSLVPWFDILLTFLVFFQNPIVLILSLLPQKPIIRNRIIFTYLFQKLNDSEENYSPLIDLELALAVERIIPKFLSKGGAKLKWPQAQTSKTLLHPQSMNAWRGCLWAKWEKEELRNPCRAVLIWALYLGPFHSLNFIVFIMVTTLQELEIVANIKHSAQCFTVSFSNHY